MKKILSCLTILLMAPSVLADPEKETRETYDKLLVEYTEARKALAEIPRPQRNDANFRKKLGLWSDANQRCTDAAQKLFPVLAEVATSARAEDYEIIKFELKQIHGDLFVDRTQAGHDALSFFAKSIVPLLRDKKLAPERATLFADLTKPDQWVREYDKMMERGQLCEPVGWDIQDAYALALGRAGKFKEARRESDLLLKKVNLIITKGRLPGVGTYHHGVVRQKKSLQREFMCHRALIEALAGDAAKARAKLKEAHAIEEPDAEIKKSQMVLEKTISSLLNE